MKNKKFIGTFGIVLAIVLVFIIVWAVVSGQNSDLAASSDMKNLSQTDAPDTSPATQQTSSPATTSDTSSPITHSPDKLTDFLRKQEDIRSDMLEDIHEEEPSGNASEDFLEAMIPHSEAGIDMAKNYLKYGGINPTLEKLAGEIITTRTSELQQMELLEDEIEDMNLSDTTKEKEFLNASQDILTRHQAESYTSTQDIEKAFAEQMASHQQMGVDMAKSIIGLTDHEEVRRLAEQIIETGEREIEQLKELVDGN